MIPDRILAQLTEHSKSGFVLFTTSPQGQIECYMHADDEVTKIALTSHALKVLSMQDQIESDMMMNGIIENMEAAAKSERKRRKKGGKGGDGPPFA